MSLPCRARERGKLIKFFHSEIGLYKTGDAAIPDIGAVFGQPSRRGARSIRHIEKYPDTVRTIAVRIRRAARLHWTAHHRTRRVSRTTFDKSWKQLDEPQMIERQVEAKEHFQVVHHHRARDEALVEQEPQDVLSEQVGGPDAERGVGLAALARVRGILFDLIHQPEQGLGLDVDLRRVVHLVRALSMPAKKKSLRCSSPCAPLLPSMREHLVQVFIGPIGTRVFGVAEPIRKAVQRSRGGDGL